MNKKIIFVILLFIGVSFIVYSFANPLTSDDKKMKDDEQYNENLDDDNDSSFEDSDSDSEDDESDEVTSEEDKEEESKPEENSDLTVANQNKQNTYGSGQRYYVNSKKPSAGSSGSASGQTPAQPTQPTPTPSNPTNPTTPVIPPAPKPTESTFSVNTPVAEGTDGTKVNVSKTGNKITLSGTMKEQPAIPGLNTGSYVTLRIVAPRSFTSSELSKMSVIKKEYNTVLTQAKDNIIIGTVDGKPYFELLQEFMEGDIYTLVIDWGDGVSMEYVIECNVKVI